MPRIAIEVVLSAQERKKLFEWAEDGPRSRAVRARILLLADQGLRNDQIVERLHGTRHAVTRNTVCTWRRKFARLRLRAFTQPSSQRVRQRTAVTT